MRIWLEKGFSRRHIAERMMRAVPELEVVMHPTQTCPGAEPLAVPSKSNGQWGAEMARLVREHRIDAFVPQNSAAQEIADIGCPVHAPATPEVLAMLNDKSAFTEWLAGDIHRAVTIRADGVDEVRTALRRMRSIGLEPCIKPVEGVNGDGYWRLTDHGDASFIDDPEPREIDQTLYLGALAMRAAQSGRSPSMLVMEWLPGPEVSIDVLCWRGVPLMHAARIKEDPEHQRITTRHALIPHTCHLVRRLQLHGIVSIQYRLDRMGRWRILEINPRPAGGSIFSEDAGIGIISNWTRILCGLQEPVPIVQSHVDVLMRRTTRMTPV